MFHNWPERPKRLPPIPRKPSSFSPEKLEGILRELHRERHRMLDIAMARDLTPGEIRFVRHILREIDWYAMHVAREGLLRMREEAKKLARLLRDVKKLEVAVGTAMSSAAHGGKSASNNKSKVRDDFRPQMRERPSRPAEHDAAGRKCVR